MRSRASGDGTRAAEEEGLAAGRRDEAGEHLDGGRLARAVGAEEAEDLAALHVEAHALHRLDLLAEEACLNVFDEVADVDEGLGGAHVTELRPLAGASSLLGPGGLARGAAVSGTRAPQAGRRRPAPPRTRGACTGSCAG